jgi:two-component system response regulator FixJ
MPFRVVYLVDEDAASRRALAAILAGLGIELWPFPSTAAFRQVAARLEPSCILLNGGPSSFHALTRLKELVDTGAGWPIILAGGRQDIRTALDAVRIGAVDYVELPPDEDQLARAFAHAEVELARSRLADGARRAAQERLAGLTPREQEILLALMAGMSNKLVAHELAISVRTVEMHRSNILRKLGIGNLAEGAVLMMEAGMMPDRSARPGFGRH